MMTCDNAECKTNEGVEKHEIILRGNTFNYAMPNPDLCKDCAEYLSQRIIGIVRHMTKEGVKD